MAFNSTRSDIEEPVVTMEPGPGREERAVTRHPAFAQIGVSRVSGHTNLYDSDFPHNAYMVIRVSKSDLMRSLNRDWHYAGNSEMIEVALSESQWATFVSSPNQGSGVPCTLQSFDGKRIPGLPAPQARVDQFNAEIKKSVEKAVAALDGLADTIDALGLSKAKAEKLREAAAEARSSLNSTIPWIVSQCDEHMEATVEKAKAEVHGYMTGVLQRAGLEALTAGTLPLAIEHKGD